MVMMTKPRTIRVTVCALNELECHSAHHASHVLSILDPDTPEPPVFATYGPHSRTTLRFHDEIDAGHNYILPQPEHIETILALGRSLVADEKAESHVLVHCQMGISRSTAATAALLAVVYPDEDEWQIFTRLLQLRPEAWPNCRMIVLTDELLGRRNRLTAALGRLYATQLAIRPEIGPYLRKHGRGREVDMAQRLRRSRGF